MIDERFDTTNLVRRQRRVVTKVETRFVSIHQRAFLHDMPAQHRPQGLVHQMRGRVIAHRCRAHHHIDSGADFVTHRQLAAGQRTVMTEDVRLDFLRVANFK